MDTLLRADIDTEPATIAVFLLHDEFTISHSPGFEITDLNTVTAVCTGFLIGLFDEFTFVVGPFITMEVSATIIATEAYSSIIRHIIEVVEGPGYKMLFLCLFEDDINESP